MDICVATFTITRRSEMVAITLISTVLTVLLLAAVVAALMRMNSRQGPPMGTRRPDAIERHEGAVGHARELAGSPAVWTVGFLLLALGVGAAAVLAVGGAKLPAGAGGMLVGVLAGVAGIAVAAYLFWGAYSAVRFRGLGNAQAVGAALWLLGLTFLAVVAVRLIVS